MSQFFPAASPEPSPPSGASFPAAGAVPAPADNVIEAVEELKAAAGAKAREFGQAAGQKLDELKDAAGRVLEGGRGQWKELGDHAVTYVRQNPGKAVLAGLGAGFLIGLLFREK